MDSVFYAYIVKDCRAVGELLFFNNIHDSCGQKNKIYTKNFLEEYEDLVLLVFIYMKYCSIAIKSWLRGIGVSSFLFCFQDFQQFYMTIIFFIFYNGR